MPADDEQIRRIAGNDIDDMTPVCVVQAMLTYQWLRGTWATNQVDVIGIDAKSQCRVSDFAKYLQHPANCQDNGLDFAPAVNDTRDHLAHGPPGLPYHWRRRAGKIAAAWTGN